MNTNQKCLIAISVILIFLVLALTAGVIATEGNFSALVGAIPFLVIVSIPGVIALSGRKKRKTSRQRPRYVVTTAAPSPSYSKVDIFAGEKLPQFCTTCGQRTKRTTSLKFEAADAHFNKYSLSHVNPLLAIYILIKLTSVAILTAIWVQLERLAGQVKGKKNQIIFQIPQCPSCSKKYSIHRHHFDFHSGRMTIFARNDLAEAIKATRSTTSTL